MIKEDKEYYPLFYKLDNKYRYLLWYTWDGPGGVVVLDDGTISVFFSLDKLEDFSRNFTEELDQGLPSLYDLDAVRDWLNDRNPENIEYMEFLDAWNLFDDVAKSLSEYGDEFGALALANFDAYDKLFASKHKRKWTDEMLDGLGRVLETGMKLFRNSVKDYSSRT